MRKKTIIILTVSILVVALCVGLIYHIVVAVNEKREEEEWQKKFDAYYAQTLIDYDNENQTYQDFEVDVVFLGDSLTAGYDIQHYYSEYTVVNRGIGGETTYGLKERLGVSVIDLQPKVCVMLIGGNNIDTMFEDYEDLLIAFQENMPQTKIVLVSLSPTSGDYADRNETLAYNNVKIKLLAEKYGYAFVDIYTPLFDLKTGEMKAEYTPDGAHFTQLGYDIVTAKIKPIIASLLDAE